MHRLLIDIKVVPNAGRTGWVIDKSGTLKCFLKSPAEQGKANAELIKTLAKALGIPQNSVTIVMGTQSRSKRVAVDAEITYDTFLELLGIEQQLKIFGK